MFCRRKARTLWERIREFLWPSMGLARLALYYRYRICRMRETPYALAAGFATGVAISFTPFLGLHLLLGGIITWALRGSLVAMVVGSVVAGNPWTFPFIWMTTYSIGRQMLGEALYVDKVPNQFIFYDLFHKPVELLLPMSIGALPFFVVSWVVAFFFARRVVRRYRTQKRRYRGVSKRVSH
ncbi:MAG: DUF2062 domain-containing protein [Alphaproteobacteria bacterium]|nr:DUF2062 domain-containing protein [Alphaproteobacteria bacterium]